MINAFKSSPKMYQSYKHDNPIDTINNILQKLIKFFPQIEICSKSYNDGYTWASAINLFKNFPETQINGKGLTHQLAVASGLAECMERLQSLLLLNREYPFLKLKENALLFQDINTGNLMEIDPTFLTWSNGDAAGNTLEEATVQALCELFERYTRKKVLVEKLECPDIPESFFSDNTKRLVRYLKEKFSIVKIKDLSLNIGLPAAGILIGNKNIGYHLYCGSAPSLNGAIERCIMELYQLNTFTEAYMSIKIKNYKIVLQLLDIFSDIYKNSFSKETFLQDHTVLLNDFVIDPNMEYLLSNNSKFVYWDYSNSDSYNELVNLVELCKTNKIQVLFKEISWFGFPTVRLRSPQLSQFEYSTYFKNNNKKIYNDWNDFIDLLRKGIDGIKTQRFLEILRSPEFFYLFLRRKFPTTIADIRKTPFHHPLDKIDCMYILFYIAYYHQEFDLAKKFAQAFILINPTNEYFQCLIRILSYLPPSELIKLEYSSELLDKLEKELSNTFSIKVINSVIADIKIPNKILDNISEFFLPCDPTLGCSNNCYFRSMSSAIKSIQKEFSNVVDYIK